MAELAWLQVRKLSDQFTVDVRNGTAKAVVRYYAKANQPTTNDAALSANDGTTAVPAANAVYSTSRPHCAVASIGVEKLTGRQFELTYNFEDPTNGEAVTAEDLLALPAVISEDDEDVMEEYTKDEDEPPKFVRNAAGEPFDKGPERLTGITAYTIEKFVNAATRAQIKAAKRTNNQTALTILGVSHAIDTLWLMRARFEPVATASGVWKALMVVKHRPEKWKDVALNVGFSEKVAGQRKDITQADASGAEVPVPRPWPLNEDGTKKATADAEPHELKFWPYKQHAWTGVPLA